MTLGKGAAYAASTRQKINTTSSTEAETVAIHEMLPQILWTRYFLEAQGYGVEDSVIYQDNQSAILLAKNGRGSSSKRTRHINIRYFFVTDRIASKEVKVEYCPTEDMIADYFTKPLQGTIFRNFRDFIMNNGPPPKHRTGDRRSVLENNKTSEEQTDGQSNANHVWMTVSRPREIARRHRVLAKKMNKKREHART